MKKNIYSIVIVTIATACLSFDFSSRGKLKLYPEIESFYSNLSKTPTSVMSHDALRDVSAFIKMGSTSDKKIYLLFTCRDNSFKSQASQVIMQSLLSVNKFNKLSVTSCGLQAAEINPVLIRLLSKHGFHIKEVSAAANGKKSYEISFGDGMSPVILYAKSSNEMTAQTGDLFQLSMCTDATTCPKITNARFNVLVPYKDLVANSSEEEEMDKEFTDIATDIVNIFNTAQAQ